MNNAARTGLFLKHRGKPIGTIQWFLRLPADTKTALEDAMGRGLLLWLIGIPIPIILVIWLFGGLN
jgi:hypothetical protein